MSQFADEITTRLFLSAKRNYIYLDDLARNRSLAVDALEELFASGEVLLGWRGKCHLRATWKIIFGERYSRVALCDYFDDWPGAGTGPKRKPPAEGPDDELGITPEGYQRVAAHVRRYVAEHRARLAKA